MFCDDGLGIYAAEYIKQNFDIPPELEIVDGGGLGFTLMTFYQEYEKVFILSTTSEGKNGDVLHFDKDELIAQGATRQSANEVEVVQMLEICSFLDEQMAHVEIIAMNPHDIMPVMANLTPEIKASFPELIAKTVHVLDAHDIKLIPKEKETTLDEIIDSFANPTQQIQIPNTKG